MARGPGPVRLMMREMNHYAAAVRRMIFIYRSLRSN